MYERWTFKWQWAKNKLIIYKNILLIPNFKTWIQSQKNLRFLTFFRLFSRKCSTNIIIQNYHKTLETKEKNKFRIYMSLSFFLSLCFAVLCFLLFQPKQFLPYNIKQIYLFWVMYFFGDFFLISILIIRQLKKIEFFFFCFEKFLERDVQ